MTTLLFLGWSSIKKFYYIILFEPIRYSLAINIFVVQFLRKLSSNIPNKMKDPIYYYGWMLVLSKKKNQTLFFILEKKNFFSRVLFYISFFKCHWCIYYILKIILLMTVLNSWSNFLIKFPYFWIYVVNVFFKPVFCWQRKNEFINWKKIPKN